IPCLSRSSLASCSIRSCMFVISACFVYLLEIVICLPYGWGAVIESWEEYRLFERTLSDYVDSVKIEPRLKKALKYAISAGGKRVRPLIVLLSGKMCGGSYETLMNLALAVEFIHTASLIHDDIIDRAERRRWREALHKKYNLSLALILGDWLISKSVELTSVYGEEIIREFSKVGMMMCDGEVMDVYSEELDEEGYFECITKKTAALFAYSAKTACKVVCADEKAAEKLFEYGLNLGIAYQMVDDLLEYLGALEDKESQHASRTILHIYAESYGDEVKRVVELIKKYSDASRKALEYFDDCEEREKLLNIVDYITSRMLLKVI
ncbi:MAG: polyprenyl synthetase family protein, partial [Archaeoglobaceae archaeon]